MNGMLFNCVKSPVKLYTLKLLTASFVITLIRKSRPRSPICLGGLHATSMLLSARTCARVTGFPRGSGAPDNLWPAGR